MAMHDRDWYRQAPRRRSYAVKSVVIRLVIANVVVFFLQLIAVRSFGWDPVNQGLGMKPDDVIRRFMVWEIVTSMFLHGSPPHLLFNMLILWMFGTPVEARLGPRAFLRFYFGAGIMAGLAYVIFGLFGESASPAVGASGAIMGVVVYFTLLNPNAIVRFLFFFPMKMKWATLIFVGIDLYWFVFSSPGQTGIAHTAHLGGALYGLLYYRYAHRLDRVFLNLEIKAKTRSARRDRRQSVDLQEEVDRLLDKVHAGGLDALSAKERKFLTEASRRLRGEGR